MRRGALASLPALQDLLWGRFTGAETFEADRILSRIYQIMVARVQGMATGSADLASLIRHALMVRGGHDRPGGSGQPRAAVGPGVEQQHQHPGGHRGGPETRGQVVFTYR